MPPGSGVHLELFEIQDPSVRLHRAYWAWMNRKLIHLFLTVPPLISVQTCVISCVYLTVLAVSGYREPICSLASEAAGSTDEGRGHWVDRVISSGVWFCQLPCIQVYFPVFYVVIIITEAHIWELIKLLVQGTCGRATSPHERSFRKKAGGLLIAFVMQISH